MTPYAYLLSILIPAFPIFMFCIDLLNLPSDQNKAPDHGHIAGVDMGRLHIEKSDEKIRNAIASKLLAINGVGPTVVEALLKYASDGPGGERHDVDRLLTQLRLESSLSEECDSALKNTTTKAQIVEKTLQHGALTGKQVVFTGHMNCMSRSVAERICEVLGK